MYKKYIQQVLQGCEGAQHFWGYISSKPTFQWFLSFSGRGASSNCNIIYAEINDGKIYEKWNNMNVLKIIGD